MNRHGHAEKNQEYDDEEDGQQQQPDDDANDNGRLKETVTALTATPACPRYSQPNKTHTPCFVTKTRLFLARDAFVERIVAQLS